MISIIDWHLEPHINDETFYIILGYVFGHPKILDGTYIHSSIVRTVKLSDKGGRLLVHTKSGNDYELAFADLDLEHIENIQASLKDFDVPVFCVEKCQKIKELSEAKMTAKVDKIVEPNELYLLIGETLKIPVRSQGMVQDSYYDSNLLFGIGADFRCFYYERGIKPYYWSDGLKSIKIENAGINDFSFYAGTEILCKKGEITTIKYEYNYKVLRNLSRFSSGYYFTGIKCLHVP